MKSSSPSSAQCMSSKARTTRPGSGQTLDEPPPGRERLAAAVAAQPLRAFEADEGPEVGLDPVARRLVVDERGDGRAQLAPDRLRRVALEDLGVGLHDLGECREAHPACRSERHRPCRQMTSVESSSTSRRSSQTSRDFPIPGGADERGRAQAGPLGVDERAEVRELGAPADEPRAGPPGRVARRRSPPRPGPARASPWRSRAPARRTRSSGWSRGRSPPRRGCRRAVRPAGDGMP